MATRRKSIRTRIILLLAVPFAALIGLWALAASSGLSDTMLLVHARTIQHKLITPTQKLVDGLQHERRLSLVYIGSGAGAGNTELTEQRALTDKAIDRFHRAVAGRTLRSDVQTPTRIAMDHLNGRLGEIRALRGAIDRGAATRDFAFDEYTSLLDSTLAVTGSIDPGNAQISQGARAVGALSKARELLTREDALVSGVLAAGRVTEPERVRFAQLVGAQRFQLEQSVPMLPAADRASFTDFEAGAPFLHLRSLEDRIAEAAPNARRLPVTAAAWDDASRPVNERFYGLQSQTIEHVVGHSQDIAIGVLLRIAGELGGGLLAVVLSIWAAIRASRRLVRETRTLAGAVEVFTRDELPGIADRVRAGELIDFGEAVADPADFRVTEIGRLSESFDAARLAVVDAARREAAAARGVNELFVNLARRNQALLHRQLGLLDTMERRVEDPLELDDLFQLDHLATCMRRHAEGLVILGGRTAGRTWRTPVPIVDVARGAVAEVEDYTRVRVTPMQRVAVSGSAAADVIHLLAELIENATMFSPPRSPVEVRGVPGRDGGFLIEVEDRGLGMTPELRAELNARLVEAPDFDLFDSARLGTFVIARLAARHGVRVSLEPSPYGGTTATVLVPDELLAEAQVTGPHPVMAEEALEPTMRPEVEEPSGAAELPRLGAFDPKDTHAGLPRRRRTGSGGTASAGPVAAQGDAAVSSVSPVSTDPAAVRSPEQVRTMMTAMQRGWQRGRDAGVPGGLEPGTGNPGVQAEEEN